MILAYARVSTLEQAKDGATSIATQIKQGRAIAALRNAGPYDFSTFVDEGVSGSLPLSERPQGKLLLEAAKAGDTIVASKMDRLFRSASDALTTAETLKKQGINLILVDMGTDPVTSNGVAKMFFGMLALVAEFERERIAERMADGRKGKRERQGHIGGSAPYGYRVVGSGRAAALTPHPDEQRLLARITELRGKRRTAAAVYKELNAEGFTTRSGRPFQEIQVQRIMERVSGRS